MLAVAVTLVVSMLAGQVQAQSRLFVGARNLAMGGTGAGSTDDAIATYYNPAGMAFARSWEVQLPLVTMDTNLEGDTLGNLDELRDLFDGETLRDIQERLDSGTATGEDLQNVLDAFLDQLPDLDTTEDGVVLRAAAGPSFRWKNWGVSAFVSGTGGLDSVIDLSTGLSLSSGGIDGAISDATLFDDCDGDPACLAYALNLVDQTGIDAARAEVLVAASGDNLDEDPRAFGILTDIVNATLPGNPTLAENPSEITTTGLLLGQATFTWSRLIHRDKLSVGINAKLMNGRTYSNQTSVAALRSDDDFEDYFGQENARTDTELGFDLGLMYRPTERWSIGLAADNVNSPEFELAGIQGAIELQSLFRAGAAYRPSRWFNVAVDLDLNEVDSGVVRGLAYQYANAGAEFLIGDWFAGRVGAYHNLGGRDTKTVFTGGLGFYLRRFSIELALGAASERTRVEAGADGHTMPRGLAASLQFGWRSGS